MRYKNSLIQTILLSTWISTCYGCRMDGVTTWFTPVTTNVLDSHVGSFFSRATEDIVGISTITYGEGLNAGPYVQVTHSNSVFDITTNDAYGNYEELETAQSMTFTVVFGCTGGNTATLVFIIKVIDTNNNPPRFVPNDVFEFTVTPPLPPGYQITGCLQDITVRDIDLTTQRIDFTIEPNDYFEIVNDASLSADPKQFKAILKTTTFLRTLGEPVELKINATDVDLTGDPPITTTATIRITGDSEFQFPEEIIFSQPYYIAGYADDQLRLEVPITLQQGYHELVKLSLEGEHSRYFDLQSNESQVFLSVRESLPPELFREGQLILAVRAEREFTSGAAAAVIVNLPEVLGLRFENTLYEGRIVDGTMDPLQLVLAQGYAEGFSVSVTGNYYSFFATTVQDNNIAFSFSGPPEPIENNFISLQVSASNAFSTALSVVTLEVISDDMTTPAFDRTIYSGSYETLTGLLLDQIVVVQGYDETVSFFLDGEHASYFRITHEGPEVSVTASSLPSEVLSQRTVLLSLRAIKPRTVGANAAIFIQLPPARELGFESSAYIGTIRENSLTLAPITMSIGYDDDVSFSLSGADGGDVTGATTFERALYEGAVREGRVRHEAITLSGYNGTQVEIYGTYADLFVASVSEGSVTVEGVSSVTLAPDVVYVALELRASDATTVLLLDVEHKGSELPTVTFGSTSYSLRADITQTGFLGRVEAAASNGEMVSYTLLIQNDHLRQRISVDKEGEIHLSAPANSGLYSFEVVATTVFSKASGSAFVRLTVEIVTECVDEKVVPPLIILDRDEEQPHKNLVIINEDHEGCRYSLTNRWPANQSWLYVDDIGLHANVIDREDSSIAFMALSQVQVELFLECDDDNTTMRSKRSIDEKTHLDYLGPYDYGDKSWILTDSILYNSRRTLVNLIVKDINDNYPIFVNKDNEPIVVGYPIPEIEERVSPKALIEVEATDADVGENAALVYWSPDEALAVSPSSGLVHVGQNVYLQDGAAISVFATDRHGQGLTGNLTLLVRLLDVSNIAVVTIKDAFLEDEHDILAGLSIGIGYEVKALRATVISESAIENASRRKRDATAYSASLQIYVYGIIEREPVHVDRLTADLTNDGITTVSITRTVSLEDHLEEMRDSSGRDTSLLVATIVLSVLLLILIVAATVWFLLKWRKERNYERFKDENSIASVDETLGNVSKPQTEPKTRINIEELKKSERRLQERLEAPIKEVTVEQNSSKQEPKLSSKDSITPMAEVPVSIIIKDKLKLGGDESEDDDEFGEKQARRRSVVTFNENVEKIIHVDETSDDDSSILEVHKF